MSGADLSHQVNHYAWQQRVNREMNEELKHNTVVDMIKQKRAPEKFGKGIKPFAVVSKANAIRFGTVASPLILQEKAATRPSDPNSMMDLGACVYALPIYQKLDE